jgi:sugar phosphate isomerase/epimerase
MPLTATDWPIAASTLPFPAVSRGGLDATHGGPDAWMPRLRELARCGFEHVDLTDSWARIADLDQGELESLGQCLREAGVTAASSSLIRRSVIDDTDGDANLAYTHRALDAAAALGMTTVSVGLHQPLTDEQRRQLWFWTVEGHHDRPEQWDDAVSRLRELTQHAESLGIVLSLEMYEDTFLGDAASTLRLLEAIDSPWIGVNPDVANLIRLHRPIDSWRDLFEQLLPHTNFWHVKNYTRDEDVANGMFTAVPAHLDVGLIDYRWAFEVAIEGGFQGVICMENYGGDGLGVSAWNRDYLRSLVLPLDDQYASQLGSSRVRQPDLSTLRSNA